MTTMTMTIADLAARRVDIDAEIERLTQEKALVNAELFKLTNEQPGNYAAGEYTLQIKAGSKRLNPDRFTERFPVAQFPMYYEAKPSINAIREYMAPIELERFMDQSKPSVTVK